MELGNLVLLILVIAATFGVVDMVKMIKRWFIEDFR